MEKIKKIAAVVTVALVVGLPTKVEARTIGLNTNFLLGITDEDVQQTEGIEKHEAGIELENLQEDEAIETIEESQEPKVFDTPILTEKEETTASSIQFEEDEFLRITQPKIKEEMSTFDKQLTLTLEARVDTIIGIEVLYNNKNLEYTSKIYDLKVVGASQTYNQVIDLEVGGNTIIIHASHEEAKDIDDLSFIIVRKSEEAKEALINYSIEQSFLLNTDEK